MIRVLEGQNFDTATDFTKALNKARLENKQNWIVYVGTVAGRSVEIKTFDIGDLQIVRVEGLQANVKQYDNNVSSWKAEIEKAIAQ